MKTKLVPKPKKDEIEKDGRGNPLGTAGVRKISIVRQQKTNKTNANENNS